MSTLREMIEDDTMQIQRSFGSRRSGPDPWLMSQLIELAREAIRHTVFELRPAMSVNENYVQRIVAALLGEQEGK